MIILSFLLVFLSVALFLEETIRFLAVRRSRLTRRLVRVTASLILAILAIEGAFVCQNGRFAFPATLFTDIMQAFSLDADYGAIAGRTWSAFSWPWFRHFLTIYTTVLYTLAPIAGGAVIYDILAGVSPSIRLALCKHKQLYVFSSLSERSVLLAESIAAHRTDRRHFAFVFTDVYAGDGESESELLLRARSLGAVCLQDDILNISSFRASRYCHFFLMDLDGGGFDDRKNITELYQLLQVSPDKPPLWRTDCGCSIFVFSDNSETIENVQAIKKSFDGINRPGDGTRTAPPYGTVTVRAIRDHALTASLLLRDKPLFLPLGAPQPGLVRPLRVVIFGSSAFAKELFKSVYWFGQLLDIQLCITVVYAPEDPGNSGGRTEFEAYLEQLCPEILDSCAAGSDPECLRVWPHEDIFAPPYALLSFLETDVRGEALRSFLDRGGRTYLHSSEQYRLADCDYYLVAGGSDTQNIDLANDLGSALMYLHSKSGRTGRPAQIIVPLVQDDDLSRIIRERFLDSRQTQQRIYGIEPPEICPFGSLKTRYSYGAVFSSEEDLARHRTGSESRRDEHGTADISSAGDDLYSSWSGIGRIFHLPYKLYCAGCADLPEVEGALRYRKVLVSDPALFDRLTWLEHRRWNAFLRVQGFTRPLLSMDELESVFGPVMPALLRAKTNESARAVLHSVTIPPSLTREDPSGQGRVLTRLSGYKDLQSKLHPCLVESDPAVIQDPDHHDLLDLITAARLYSGLIDSYRASDWEARRDRDRSDVKSYDMPWGDRLPTLEPRSVLRWLRDTGSEDGMAGKTASTLSVKELQAAWDALLRSDSDIGRELAAYPQTWER